MQSVNILNLVLFFILSIILFGGLLIHRECLIHERFEVLLHSIYTIMYLALY